MVSQIQLGNLFNVNGRTVLGGGNSAIDTKALLEGLSEAKRAPAVKLEGTIELNGKKSEALGELKEILNRFKDASNFLRNPPGVQNDADNIFQYRKSDISSNTAIAGSVYLGATVAPGAQPQSYTISNVTTLAQAKKQQSNVFAVADANTAVAFAVPGPGQFGVGTITVNGENITINNGDSLNQISARFNAVKDDTGITTSVIQVSPGNFRMVFTATETGLSADFDMSNPATVTADPSGVLTNITFNNLQVAQNAQFDLDGVAITRETNTIDDLLDDVTLTLNQTTPPGTNVKLDIEADTQLIKDGITNFVNAYNEFKIFAAKQMQIGDDGLPTEDSVLFNNSSLRAIINRVSGELSRVVDGLASGDPSRLADLGIKFSDYPGDDENPFTRNVLTIDEGTLDNALSGDLDKVRRVFEFDFVSGSTNLQVFSRTNALNVTNFDLSIDQVGDIYTATYDPGTGPVVVNLDFEHLSGGGVTLTGQAGTPLEGLVMIYAASTNDAITVNVSQGVGDRVFNALEELLEDDTGMLDSELTAIEDANERIQKEITRIDESIERFREDMLLKFAALEKALSTVNTLLQSLDAQAQARLANS